MLVSMLGFKSSMMYSIFPLHQQLRWTICPRRIGMQIESTGLKFLVLEIKSTGLKFLVLEIESTGLEFQVCPTNTFHTLLATWVYNSSKSDSISL